MQIRDLTDADFQRYQCCLEEYEPLLDPGKPYKAEWYNDLKNKGLRIKLAVDDDAEIAGFIHYAPIEQTPIRGQNLYFVYCIWVHGHKLGIGNRQQRGLGKALLEAAENDAKCLGAKGLVAWGLRIPVWMKAAWFRKHGYKVADKKGMMALVYIAFSADCPKPAFPKPRKKVPKARDRVIISDFICGWCTYTNVTHAHAARIAAEYPADVELMTYNLRDPTIREEWGIGETLFINGKEIRMAPPLSYEALKAKVEKQIQKLKR